MTDFKIAAAQVTSVSGDIERNVMTHAAALRVAAAQSVSLVVFPELSLVGYDPEVAAGLTLTATDRRLLPLARLARRYDLLAIVGAALQDGAGKPKLGAIVLGPGGISKTYHKMHLGGVEPDYFSRGETPLLLRVGQGADAVGVGVAICADSGQPAHPEAYGRAGAQVYAVGVCLTAEWYETDVPRLAAHARNYGLLTVMANHAASEGRYESVGKSAIWTPEGNLLVQAIGSEETLLIASRTNGQWRGERVSLADV